LGANNEFVEVLSMPCVDFDSRAHILGDE